MRLNVCKGATSLVNAEDFIGRCKISIAELNEMRAAAWAAVFGAAAAGSPQARPLFDNNSFACPHLQTPTEAKDIWMPLGKGEFSNEDGCVSAWCLLLCCCSVGMGACQQRVGSVLTVHLCMRDRCTWYARLQGGGFGEVHLKVTYWPFELIKWHRGGPGCGRMQPQALYMLPAQHFASLPHLKPCLPPQCRGQARCHRRHGAQVSWRRGHCWVAQSLERGVL